MGDRKGRPYGVIEAVLDFDMGDRKGRPYIGRGFSNR